ncbi:hypothetical protein P7C70_g5638, partial [Phenoliferia sp. Uapishka_3]
MFTLRHLFPLALASSGISSHASPILCDSASPGPVAVVRNGTLQGLALDSFAQEVSAHLLAYGSNSTSLFRGGILESGSPTTENYATAKDLQPSYDSIIHDSGCSGSSNSLDCLRALPYDTWNRVANASNTNGTVWQPVVDGDFITRLPTSQLNAQEFVHVPLLLGGTSAFVKILRTIHADLFRSTANSDEGTAFGSYGIDNDAALRQSLSSRYPLLQNRSIDKILSLYVDDPTLGSPYGTGDGYLATGVQDKRSCSIFGDTTMIAPRRLLAETAAQQSAVFSYRFNQVTQNMSMDIGEVAYVFSNPLPTQNPLGNRPSDLSLAEVMTSHWISFIHDLDPNHTKVNGTVQWPNYACDTSNMVFERQGSYIEPDTFRAEGIKFINQLGAELKH